MSRREKDQLHLARINFLNLIGQSNPSDAWKLFCLVTPNITEEQVDDQAETSSKLTLTTIPPDVVEMIVRTIDIESEKNVRLTAKYLKQIVDARDTMINRVHIHLCSQTVGIEVHEVTKEEPETYSFNVSVIPGVNHIDNAVKKFEEIISKPNTKINHLKIDWVRSEENRASYDELLKSLAVSLADFVEKVHVEELTIDVNAVEHLENLICSLKPDILKRLYVIGPPTCGNDKFDFSNIVILPQWKHLSAFTSSCCELICPIHHLYHISNLRIKMASTSPIDIVGYRDTLIVSQQRIDHEITISHDMENTKQMLEPYIDCSRLTTCRGYYIRSNEKRLTFELKHNKIIFSTMQFLM
ncbi:hypothetical protein CRE_00244 [Caenorhabditis remanei]|uniref:F-box domain-containing protein n=1 Tax=Caenorhabditis remanei TaxID=31234 RepID=E3LE09_CAERE|nr:hypothetical protein CRE_00244 [Caenorhabditis remanei]